MLFKKAVKDILLVTTIGLLCSNCATTKPHIQLPANMNKSPENMGMAYVSGRGVPEDPAQAIYWLKKAAKKGSSTAANELGYLYASGNGIPQDYSLALHWYHQAADAGVASAKYNLGLMYRYGLGTAIDQVKANDYFNQAAALGFKLTHQPQ